MLLTIVLSTAVASCLNLIGHRLVVKEDFVRGRSKCDHCQTIIPACYLIPVLGYMICRGRCRTCRHTISAYHPISELIFASAVLAASQHKQTGLYLIIASFLLVMSASDLHRQIVPDRLQIGLLLTGLCYYLLNMGYPSWSQLIASSFLFMLLLGLSIAMPAGIGGADIKLLTILCFFLGLSNCLLIILLACLAALSYWVWLYSQHKGISGLPFVPFISLAYSLWLLLS